jgi:hypothetical protein
MVNPRRPVRARPTEVRRHLDAARACGRRVAGRNEEVATALSMADGGPAFVLEPTERDAYEYLTPGAWWSAFWQGFRAGRASAR